MARGENGTVGKALEVLDRVAAFGRPVRFAELLAGSPFPKATLYRLLQTLVRQEMLVHDPQAGTYTPGIRLLRLAHAAWRQSSLAPVARPHLRRLSRAVEETVHLAQLDGGQVLYLDKLNAARPVEMFSEAGKVGPAYCTGVGKAMLAFLDDAALETALSRQSFHRFTDATLTEPATLRTELARIRARGFATDAEEHEPGIICVAAPILGGSGRVLGAVSVTSTTLRRSLDDLQRAVPLVRRTAEEIAADAASWRFPDESGERRKA